MDDQVFQRKVTSIIQLFSIFLISAAFFGFLVTNIYLSLFGFWDFNFLRSQDISSGVLFLFLIGVSIGLCLISHRICIVIRNHERKSKNFLIKFILWVVRWSIILFLSYLNFILISLPMILGTVLSHPTGFLSSIAAIWVIIVWLATYVSKKSQAEIRENYTDIESLKNTFKYIFAGYKIFVMLLFTPVLIGIFSVFVYPMVPRYLGGGEPTPVAIYFEKNSDVSYISSSTPYYGLLIYQSPDFVLTKDDKRVFLIKQENIAYQEYFSQKISIMATK